MPRPYRDGYEPFPRAVRMAALRAAGGQCQACGRDDLPLEVDHVVAQSLGGASTEDNAVAICTVCHEAKSAYERRQAITASLPARAAKREAMTRNIEQHPNAPRTRTEDSRP